MNASSTQAAVVRRPSTSTPGSTLKLTALDANSLSGAGSLGGTLSGNSGSATCQGQATGTLSRAGIF